MHCPPKTKEEARGCTMPKRRAMISLNRHQKFRLRNYYAGIGFKPCWVCGEVKRFGDFYVNNARTDNLDARCKYCQREYQSANSVRLQAKARDRYELNFEHKRKLDRLRRIKHRDKINARNIARYDPVKRSARDAVVTALRNGTLVSPGECSHCSRGERIEAHHPDYSKKLEVVWLCSRCHHRVHSGVIVL